MRVFLDENMPLPLWKVMAGHEVSWVEKEDWKGKKNGELLSLVEVSFDVLLTSDGSMSFQNELTKHDLSLVVLPTNNLTILLANAIALQTVLNDLEAHLELGARVLVEVDWKGRRTMTHLNPDSSPLVVLESVPPFGR